MQLEEAVRAHAPIVPEIRDLDVSDLFGEPPKSSIWQFRGLSVVEAWNTSETIQQIQFQRKDYPKELCAEIALLSVAHVAPEGQKQPSHILFANLGERIGWAKFGQLRRRFVQLFPELGDLEKAGAEKKTDDSAGVQDAAPVPGVSAPPAEGDSTSDADGGSNAGCIRPDTESEEGPVEEWITQQARELWANSMARGNRKLSLHGSVYLVPESFDPMQDDPSNFKRIARAIDYPAEVSV